MPRPLAFRIRQSRLFIWAIARVVWWGQKRDILLEKRRGIWRRSCPGVGGAEGGCEGEREGEREREGGREREREYRILLEQKICPTRITPSFLPTLA